jgi:CubicO group peptidase (beta-lactamase class C family)
LPIARPDLVSAALLTGLFAAGGAEAQSVRSRVTRLDGRSLSSAEVERTVERLMRAGRVPGLALAILNKGEVVYLNVFGVARADTRTPLTDTTVMYAASFTKSMFAYMVMQLVEEKALDLDRSIARYLAKPLSEYEKYADLAGDERWRRITPRMLLSHTSGLPNWRWFRPNETLDIMFEPGARYSYSGEGINLLQFVIEEATGRQVGDLMQERVFGPLGMSRTSMVWQPAFEADHAFGYDEDGKDLGYRKRTSARAAGSAATTIRDVARFLQAMLRSQGIARAGRDEMLTPQIRIRSVHQFPVPSTETTTRDDSIRLSYGLGWGLLWSPYGKAYFKEGHDDGWENYMITFEQPGTAIVIMTNSSNGESIFTELLATLIGDRFTPSEWEQYVPYDAAAK